MCEHVDICTSVSLKRLLANKEAAKRFTQKGEAGALYSMLECVQWLAMNKVLTVFLLTAGQLQ